MFAEDLSLFFGDFNQQLSIDGKTANAIFSNETIIADDVITQTPHLIIQSSVLEDLEASNGCEVILNNGIAYEIASIQPDGTGISIVYLEKKWNI
jgi:hypothetical protein